MTDLSPTNVLIVELDCSNDAFQSDGNGGRTEAARLLREAADRIEAYKLGGRLKDQNGNSVGFFTMEYRG